MKKRLLSGITATGQLTIGNYLGAIKNFVKLQNEYDVFVFVADMHALTLDIKPDILTKNKRDIFAIYLAAGLDPEKATIFFQSDVIEHGQINWIMESRTTIGELERMTQFKDKSLKSKQKNGTTKIKTTLLTYPTLMAGDILLYSPEIVPTGQDQKQHIELARNIAERFNNEFSQTFILPKPFFPKIGAKIMSLKNPEQKMSKSDDHANASIYLLDDPAIAASKIKKAVTDSENKIYLSDKKPGIKNLLTIYASLKDISLEAAASYFQDKNYGELKTELGDEVKLFLTDLQAKYQTFMTQIEHLSKLGQAKAKKVAAAKLKEIQTKIGL